MDYVGGSASSPYVDALEFSRSYVPSQLDNKFQKVVAKFLEEHATLLEAMPLAIRLLPDPAQCGNMSKRLWERVVS